MQLFLIFHQQIKSILTLTNTHLLEKVVLGFFIILTAWACISKPETAASSKPLQTHRFAFYNVENLFDTLDTPGKIDEEFLPSAEKNWNTKRYQKKLSNLTQVMEGMQYPAIIGLCEVENKTVLEDFVGFEGMKKHDYEIVHYESPDMRGIDAAFLYQKDVFKLIKSDYIRIPFPDNIEKGYTSRDILCVEGEFEGAPCYFFVNHWPSRRGGTEASEPKRMHVAQFLRDRIDKIQKKNPKASIFVMGDFNDETDNSSVKQVLQAATEMTPVKDNILYNCSAEQDKAGKGSYNWRGQWNMMDQFIVSGSTLNGVSPIKTLHFEVYDAKEIQFYDKRNEMYRPNRTYGGPRYFGGYSDHLPIYIDVAVGE